MLHVSNAIFQLTSNDNYKLNSLKRKASFSAPSCPLNLQKLELKPNPLSTKHLGAYRHNFHRREKHKLQKMF